MRARIAQATHAHPRAVVAFERREIEQCRIGELRRHHVRDRAENRLDATRMLRLPFGQHRLDGLALQVLLRAAEIARHDRKAAQLGVFGEIGFRAVRERPDHDVAAIVGAQLRRHRLQRALVEEIEEQRLDDVVAMMAERDLRESVFGGERVQRAARRREHTEQRLHIVLPSGITRRTTLYVSCSRMWNGDADAAQIIRQHARIVAWLLLIEMHRDELETHRRFRLQLQQNVEQRVRILAAR